MLSMIHMPRRARPTALQGAGLLVALTSACSEPSTTQPGQSARSRTGSRFERSGTAIVRGRIAFTSSETGDQEIYTINEDGSGLRRLTTSADADFDPAWSPDGKKIAFTSRRAGAGNLFVMNGDGSGVKQITTQQSAYDTSHPAWSPDGKKIVFALRVSSDEQALFVVGANGNGLQKLTSGPGVNVTPTWSPDGTQIVFGRSDGPADLPHLVIMDADGTDLEPLIADCPSACTSPDWSPDGSSILYSTFDGARRYSIATHIDISVRDGAEAAAWAPDGAQVVYTGSAASQLSVINADGTDPKAIVTVSRFALPPGVDWGRAP